MSNLQMALKKRAPDGSSNDPSVFTGGLSWKLVQILHELKILPLNDHGTPFCSDPAGGVSPAEKLSPEHLQLLRNAFTGAGVRTHENRPNRRSARNRGENEERGIHFEEFREVLRSVIGPDIEDTWVERFFSEVRRNKAQIKRCQYW